VLLPKHSQNVSLYAENVGKSREKPRENYVNVSERYFIVFRFPN